MNLISNQSIQMTWSENDRKGFFLSGILHKDLLHVHHFASSSSIIDSFHKDSFINDVICRTNTITCVIFFSELHNLVWNNKLIALWMLGIELGEGEKTLQLYAFRATCVIAYRQKICEYLDWNISPCLHPLDFPRHAPYSHDPLPAGC